jgi:cell division protein FtsL
MNEEKNMAKEESREGKIILFTTIVIVAAYIICNEIYKRKLEEKNEDLENKVETKENQIKMKEMIIKEKTNQLSSIISKIKLVESPSSWQRIKETSKEI